jgi:hypothetical protein
MTIGMADGSVRTVGPGVSKLTWYYAGQPADRQALGNDW